MESKSHLNSIQSPLLAIQGPVMHMYHPYPSFLHFLSIDYNISIFTKVEEKSDKLTIFLGAA